MSSFGAGAALAVLLSAQGARAAASARVTAKIDDSRRVTLQMAHPPERDLGALPESAKVRGATLVLGRTAAQERDLEALIRAQHDAASPLFHQWLKPAGFAERFGAAPPDVAAATAWLRSHGFTIDGATPGRIRFSGTAGQIRAAFQAELHRYASGAFAPATDATIPEALGALVTGLSNVSSFRPKSHLKPAFTSGQTGGHFLTPLDIATIYNLTPVYAAGFDGTGQTIVVIGQSSIQLSDIEHFQAAAGVTVHDPVVTLVPGSGTATIVSGDQAESDLDLEYTSSIAPGATVNFVFTGNNPNFGAFDSLAYAIEEDLAPVISASYGICEASLGQGNYEQLNSILAQAASQGQSVVASTGDVGSTDCSGTSGLSTAAQQALAVDFPASSQYVTGVGGTEFGDADAAPANTTFWASNGTGDVFNSAKSYIPEQVWNDDVAAGALSSGGGGVSAFTGRPSFQTGVTGIPTGTMRVVPDVALSSSSKNAPYLFCSSDTNQTNVTGSCAHGFRDTNSTFLTTGGGTSFAAPVFAGMVALLNQKFSPEGQGVVASVLYTAAARTPAAFHDVTAGSNACTAGVCSAAGAGSYSATAGYDPASGLGSVDFNQLFTSWPVTASTLTASKVTLTPATAAPGPSTADVITIAVAPASSGKTAVPTGNVVVRVDAGAGSSKTVALASGAATFTFSSAVVDSHVVVVNYSGDATYAKSAATVALTVPSGPAFAVSAAGVTVAAGSTGQSAVVVNPANGYAGTVAWTVSSTPALSQGCFSIPSTQVSGTTHTALSITAGSACAAVASLAPVPGSSSALFALALVGLLGLRSRRKWLACLVAVGLGFSACGGSSSSTLPPAGIYAVTLTGTDTATASITATTSLGLVIQ
jgi:subtilase family serine protease